jgi:hypothetical protein
MTMLMAKARKEEIEIALKLAALLENVESGYYPMPTDGSDSEDEPSFFDPDDKAHIRAFYDRAMALMSDAPGGIFRVVGGFHTLMTNDIVDPDINHLKLHPRFELALKDAERYRWLKTRDIDTIHRGGIFCGIVPDNVVINGEHLDAAIDREIMLQNPPPPMKSTHSG